MPPTTAEAEDLPSWRRVLEFCVPYIGIKRRGEDDQNLQRSDRTILRRALPGWQIFMIAIGGVIGITIFSTHGEIIKLAGPGGLLVATLFVALTMICVMECIGELVILWPVSNAMVEYVRTFLDEDLAIVIGIAYWYTFSCIFATLIIVAAEFASYTITSAAGRGILFYAVVPLLLVLINVLGVEYYGFIEGLGGAVKMLMVITGILFMVVKAPEAHSTNLNDGFQHQPSVARSKFEAICVAIPLIAYGYVGTEIVAVTAFEAIDRRQLRFPARMVSYIIALSYFLSALLECFLVSYKDPDLESVDGSPDKRSTADPERADSQALDFYAVIVIAAQKWSSTSLGQYFNGCIVYFCISAANTALYVASRTLFGLTRSLNRDDSIPFLLKPLRHFGVTTPTRQVPLFALLFSAVAFYWLVPLQLARGFEISDLLAVMSTTASIGGFIVWASQCLVFIRYYCWLRQFRKLDTEDNPVLPPKYNRWEPRPKEYLWHANRMFLSDLKLIPAIAGFSGCFCIIFIFSSATWWNNGDATMKKLATAYAGPVILTAIFVGLKLYNRRWFVTLPIDPDKLAQVTGDLERSSNLRYTPDGSAQAEEVLAERNDLEGGVESSATAVFEK